MNKRYCFISYSSKDRKFVERLATDLSGNNLDIFFDKWEIKVGDSIVGKINSGLEKMTELVIVLSKESVKSNWVKKELSTAMMKRLKNKSIRILPVLIEKCKIPLIINDLHFADFTEAYENGVISLTDSLDVTSSNQNKPVHVVKPLELSSLQIPSLQVPLLKSQSLSTGLAKIKPKRYSDLPAKTEIQQMLNGLIDIALLYKGKDILFCGHCKKRIYEEFNNGITQKRPLVCSNCGNAINWIGIKTKIIKQCPVCINVYSENDNFCPHHYPAVTLVSKEVEMEN